MAKPRRMPVQKRAQYLRANYDLLINEPDAQPVYWLGLDSGGGAHPIGPHGPYPYGPAGLPAVNRATVLIANELAALPWRVLTSEPTSDKYPQKRTTEAPTPRWLADPMLLRPDARIGESPYPASQRMSRPLFWAQWIRNALLFGMGFLIFQESDSLPATPLAGTLRILDPLAVEPYETESGAIHRRIGGEVITDRDNRFSIGGVRYRLLELNNPAFPVDSNGYTVGVLEAHSSTFNLAAAQREYAKSTFASGVPFGYLKTAQPNMNAAQAEALREKWLSAHGSTRSIAVLNAQTEFKAVSFSPIDTALAEMSRLNLLDLALIFGVPPHFLGAPTGDSLTYATSETRAQDYQTWTLLPWATAIEESLSALLPAGQQINIDMRGILRADTPTRYNSYSTALSDGWLLKSEVRAIEGLVPIPGIDDEPEPEPPPQPQLQPQLEAGGNDEVTA